MEKLRFVVGNAKNENPCVKDFHFEDFTSMIWFRFEDYTDTLRLGICRQLILLASKYYTRQERLYMAYQKRKTLCSFLSLYTM